MRENCQRKNGERRKVQEPVENDRRKVSFRRSDDFINTSREAARRLLEKRSNCVAVCAVGLV